MSDAPQGGPGTPEAAASYVAALSSDLATIARRHGLIALSYLLDLARLEAENISRKPDSHNKPS